MARRLACLCVYIKVSPGIVAQINSLSNSPQHPFVGRSEDGPQNAGGIKFAIPVHAYESNDRSLAVCGGGESLWRMTQRRN
ncbi:hypothetical protein BS47DRAFT_816642 [Hydnum rufescens UP504]|uniref:Uncharacterized protein n=1 Tax=Hydnum rufescens UP504 TaxID=1448309 RepID=A0A9P6ACW2_9AGAM|nr:hypothetical protein BS47DRAFT_816642 [Hydnum rufescens UP504]